MAEQEEGTGKGFSLIAEVVALAEVIAAIGSPEKAEKDQREAGE